MQNVIINILICRLQANIKRDAAAKNLLQILRPGMVRLITYAKQTGAISGNEIEQLLTEMQAVAIEYLLHDYKIGDRGRATPYLFDPHKGFLVKWLKWITSKNRKFYFHHELYSPNDFGGGDNDNEDVYETYGSTTDPEVSNHGWGHILQGSDSLKYDPYVNEDAGAKLVIEVTDIIHDGVTLNTNEFRVIKFCITNGNEANNTRHIDGLHIYLSRLLGVSRPRITRLYKRAKEKIKKKYSEIDNEQ